MAFRQLAREVAHHRGDVQVAAAGMLRPTERRAAYDGGVARLKPVHGIGVGDDD